MKRWTYTDDIHNSITINNTVFRLNTAYDNIFKLLKYMENKNIDKYETFFNLIFLKSDYEKFKVMTKNWALTEYLSLIEFIMNEYILSGEQSSGKKTSDVHLDSELIFASFYFDYGISLIEKKGKMTWKEFMILYSNLSPQSPLGRASELCSKNDKDLTVEGKIAKRERLDMLSNDVDIKNQLDNLAKFLKVTAKKR